MRSELHDSRAVFLFADYGIYPDPSVIFLIEFSS